MNYLVLLDLMFQRRLRDWDSFAQVELDSLQEDLRRLGLELFFTNSDYVPVDRFRIDADGDLWVDFWMRVHGTWTPLYLGVKTETAFVLFDRRPA